MRYVRTLLALPFLPALILLQKIERELVLRIAKRQMQF